MTAYLPSEQSVALDEEPAAGDSTSAARYACLKSSMSQEITLANDRFAFAQTANAAVRRVACSRRGASSMGACARGGRVRTDARTFSLPIDVGGAWIHNFFENPTGRIGTPFSRNRNAPHEPAPVR